jgi:hypothetical protein
MYVVHFNSYGSTCMPFLFDQVNQLCSIYLASLSTHHRDLLPVFANSIVALFLYIWRYLLAFQHLIYIRS